MRSRRGELQEGAPAGVGGRASWDDGGGPAGWWGPEPSPGAVASLQDPGERD